MALERLAVPAACAMEGLDTTCAADGCRATDQSGRLSGRAESAVNPTWQCLAMLAMRRGATVRRSFSGRGSAGPHAACARRSWTANSVGSRWRSDVDGLAAGRRAEGDGGGAVVGQADARRRWSRSRCERHRHAGRRRTGRRRCRCRRRPRAARGGCGGPGPVPAGCGPWRGGRRSAAPSTRRSVTWWPISAPCALISRSARRSPMANSRQNSSTTSSASSPTAFA